MSGTAMIPESQGQRVPLRWSAGGGIIGVVRGLALAGPMLAGLLLLLVPLMAVILTAVGAGVLIVGNGPSGDHRFMTGVALVAAGLGIGRLFVPSALLALRRLANQIRRLAGEWSGEPIAVPYQPPAGAPGERLSFRQRLFWLLGDPATWRDMLWVTVNAVLGWLIALVPDVLAGVGLLAFIDPATGAGPHLGIARPAFPHHSTAALLGFGIGLASPGCWKRTAWT